MGKGTNTTTNQTTTAPDPTAMAAYNSVLQNAQGVAQTPYQPYTGELVAPFNSEQNQGVAGVNQYANAAQPAIGQALSQATTSSAPLSTAQIQQYESPYTQSVVDATQNQFNDANAQQQQQVTGNAVAQGALGGNRSAVAAAETAKSQQLAQAPVIAGLENTGYNNAVTTAEQQQGIGLQGASTIGGLGVAGQTAGLTGAGTQLSAGAQQQATQQAQDTANYGQFQNQQSYPFQIDQWLAGLDTGVGSQMGGTSSGSTTAPAPNLFGQIAGGVTSGAGLLGATGAFGSAGWLAPALLGLARGGVAQLDDMLKRASGGSVSLGVVPHFAAGGWSPDVGPVPYSGGKGYIPTNTIHGGSGAPHISAPAPYQVPQNPLAKQASDIGALAKNITQGVNGQTPGSAVAGAQGPTSVGGASGPTPLVGVAPYGGAAYQNSTGGFNGMSDAEQDAFQDSGGFAHGGVAGFDDGGVPTADDSDSVNPGDPIRLDPKAMDDWRKGVDHKDDLPDAVPLDGPSADPVVAKARGVVPSHHAMAFSGDPDSTSGLPSEVALGYSNGVAPPEVRARNESAGTAPTPSKGIDWSENGKLWPSLISAGAGMLASRSPFFGNAVGEGLGAGASTYAAEQKAEREAQQHAEQLALERERLERPYSEMTAAEKATSARADVTQRNAAINQPVIIGPNGKPMVNPEYIKAKEEAEKSFKPVPGQIDELPSGQKVFGWMDPNTKKYYDSQGNPYTPKNPAFAAAASGTPPATTPSTLPSATTPPAAPKTAVPAPTSPPAPSFNDRFSGAPDTSSPAPAATPSRPTPKTVDEAASVPTPPPPPVQVAPHPADPNAPKGSEGSRNTALLADIAAREPGYAAAIKKAADYELDPTKVYSMRNDKREKFMQNVLAYDPNWNPQELNLRYKAQSAFLPGTKTGDTVRSFNTAVSHLDTLQQLYKAVDNSDWKTYNRVAQAFEKEFGYAPPNTLNGISQIVGGEVVKATVGSQNALGDREELRKTLDPALSNGQALDVINHFQSLMGGQLHSLKFAYEQGTGLNNFEEKFLLPRSREVLHHIDAGGASSTSAKPTLQQFLEKAHIANPNKSEADLTAYYNKTYGGQ
jgi:hypothetical protein